MRRQMDRQTDEIQTQIPKSISVQVVEKIKTWALFLRSLEYSEELGVKIMPVDALVPSVAKPSTAIYTDYVNYGCVLPLAMKLNNQRRFLLWNDMKYKYLWT